MTHLMSIGVFARATRLSVRALRHYDRLGLLVPDSVDPGTGYRRYTAAQFARAGLIRRLRELEIGLPEVAEILDAGGPAQVRAAIERHHRHVVARAARLQEIAATLEAELADDEREPGRVPVHERWRDAQPTARVLVRSSLSGLAEALGPGFAQLFAALGAQGVAPAGPPGARYLDDDLDAPALDVELFVPVVRPPRAAGSVGAGELPACLLAATVHEGGYDGVDVAYRSLGRWIADHARQLDGPAEELYLVPPGPGVPAHALRTEVAWPVRPEPAPPSPPRELTR